MGLLNALPTALGEHVAVYIVYMSFLVIPSSLEKSWVGGVRVVHSLCLKL